MIMKKNNGSVLVKKEKKQITSKTLMIIFCGIFIYFGIESIIFAVMTDGNSFRGMLFHNGVYTDWFMDFFNSIRDSAASNVYSERNSIYPPLAVAFFRFIGRMLPYAEVALDPKDNYNMQESQLCIMYYLIFAITMVVITYRCILKKVYDEKMRRLSDLFAFLTIFSYPLIYCLERGNIVAASVALTVVFVFYRNSESKVLREISYICLALAAGLKLYPALFGFLLLFDKKYKQAVRLIIYGILAVVIPFVLISTIPAPVQTSRAQIIEQRQKLSAANKYGALDREKAEKEKADEKAKAEAEVNADSADNSKTEQKDDNKKSESVSTVMKLLNNFASFKKTSGINFSSVSIQNLSFMCEKISNACDYVQNTMPEKKTLVSFCKFIDKFISFDYQNVAYVSMIVCELLAVALLFIMKKPWQRTFLLSYLFLNVPNFSSSYALWFLIIPIVFFLYDKDLKVRTKTDVLITVLFALLFSPIPTFMAFDDGAVIFFCQVALKMTYNSKVNQLIATPVFQLIFFILLIQAIVTVVRRIKSASVKKKEITSETAIIAQTAETAE